MSAIASRPHALGPGNSAVVSRVPTDRDRLRDASPSSVGGPYGRGILSGGLPLSPQTRRGRATPTGNRRSSSRQRLDAQRRAVRPQEPLDGNVVGSEESEYEAPHRGIRYRAQRSTMLRSFYAYTRVYIPFVLVFIVLLGGLFVYKQINPDVTLAQRWQNIETKWEPQRAAALDSLANDTDLNQVVVDYGKLKTATQGWMSDLGSASDWAPATAAVQTLLTDTQSYVQSLAQAASATSTTDLGTVSQTLITDSQTFATEVATVRLQLGLRATDQPTASLGASGASPSGAPSGSASSSGSASPSASGSASSSPSGSASAAASPSAS